MSTHGLRRPLYISLVFVFAVWTTARWVGCCRPEPVRPPIQPTTIPVILDDPNDADIDTELERADDE